MRLGGGDNRVRRGKVAKMLIKVVGVVAIIAFFSAFYCWGFWDVMGAMKRVPVGIVNLDEGACIGDKTMNLGADIVEAAQESEDATFVSLDKGAMDNGIEGSGYLIVFEIPSDFSQRVASGQNGLPSVADLTILKNERYNFIYSQFASRITSALETSIYQQIAKAYTVGAYEGLFSARDGLSDVAASMQEVEGVRRIWPTVLFPLLLVPRRQPKALHRWRRGPLLWPRASVPPRMPWMPHLLEQAG